MLRFLSREVHSKRRDVPSRLQIVIAIGTTRICLTKLTTKGVRHVRDFLEGLDPLTFYGDVSVTLHGLMVSARDRVPVRKRPSMYRVGALDDIMNAQVTKAKVSN